MRKNPGFSLFEILLTVTLIFLVALIITPSYRGFTYSNDLAVSLNLVVQSLYQAQQSAQAGENGSDWGVKVETGRLTVFRGASFTNYNPVTDHSVIVPSSINFTGLPQVVFTRFTGLPKSAGQIVIANPVGDFKVITISDQGTIDY